MEHVVLGRHVSSELAMQLTIFDEQPEALRGPRCLLPPRGQLLKWIGNKQRFAAEIAAYFPCQFNRYVEPFLGSGAVLGTMAPSCGLASDAFAPLIEIWQTLKNSPDTVKEWYEDRWIRMHSGDRRKEYECIKSSYNVRPNGADLLFLCRSCYGGVVRFRQTDGYMSTPIGIHKPIPVATFAKRVDDWRERIRNTEFRHCSYEETLDGCDPGDLVYCDPPYSHSQAILYGAQQFSLRRLLKKIRECKERGALVALSIDGTKQSGGTICNVPIPVGLFEREVLVHCGRSMLKRFQMEGRSLEAEVVHDRLLLTF